MKILGSYTWGSTVCDAKWLARVCTLNTLLRTGLPTTRLVREFIGQFPESIQHDIMSERDDLEELLPLQYAAGYRLDPAVVAELRAVPRKVLPPAAPSNFARQ